MKRFRRLAWALPLALLLAGLSYSRPTPEDAIAQVFQSPNGELFELQLVRELRKEQLEEQRQQLIKYALNLIVMVGGQLAGSPTIGAGIIFGADKQNLYIATANHVVRRGQDKVEDLRINFQIRPFTALEAELLNAVDVDLDLAVIKLPYWGFVHEGMDACPPSFSMVGNIQLVKVGNSPAPPEVFSNVTMKRGDAVYPVGNPNGVAWGMPVTADRLASISGHVLTFESNFISRGHSGGALLSEAGGFWA